MADGEGPTEKFPRPNHGSHTFMGRPPKYRFPEKMQERISEYFVMCDQQDKPYTIAGLCFYLGFADRHALDEYVKKPDFSATVKRAKLCIETQRSEMLLEGKGNTAGLIFDMANNFGYGQPRQMDPEPPEDDNVIEGVFVEVIDDALTELIESKAQAEAGSGVSDPVEVSSGQAEPAPAGRQLVVLAPPSGEGVRQDTNGS